MIIEIITDLFIGIENKLKMICIVSFFQNNFD